MDPIVFALVLKFVPWLVLSIGAVALSRSALARELTKRLREGSATGADIAALAAELQEVRHELSEVHERLDFTERVLSQHRGGSAFPPTSDHDSPLPPALSPSGGR